LDVRLDADDPTVGKLKIVADLAAADEAGRIDRQVGGPDFSERGRNGTRA
jgi:hypothetical protein